MNTIPILVLGAGELGMPVLRNLVRRIDSSSRITITVLLRHSSINPSALSKQRDVNEFAHSASTSLLVISPTRPPTYPPSLKATTR
jgi:hypothetical protein